MQRCSIEADRHKRQTKMQGCIQTEMQAGRQVCRQADKQANRY